MTELKKAAIEYSERYSSETYKDGSCTVIPSYTARNSFESGAEWQAKQSPWISVEERLPDDQCIVMVRGEYGGKCTAYLHGKNSGFITYGEDAYKVFGEVTHWMPIPE